VSEQMNYTKIYLLILVVMGVVTAASAHH
jgi:hypothetical protein